MLVGMKGVVKIKCFSGLINWESGNWLWLCFRTYSWLMSFIGVVCTSSMRFISIGVVYKNWDVGRDN